MTEAERPVAARMSNGLSQLTALHPQRPLLHEEGACLPLRSLHGQCRACADICPVSALTVTVSEVALSDACIGCGRCAAACPTGALSLMDAETLPFGAAEPGILRIECRKVPQDALLPGTVVLPCTGALTVGQILAQQADGRAVEVVDRGWCTGCEANGGQGAGALPVAHPAQAAVEEAALWLGAIGVDDLPRLVHEPLNSAKLPRDASEERDTPTLGRRALFQRVAQPPPEPRRAVTPMGGPGRAAYPAEMRRPSPERELRLAALGSLAERMGATLPAELFPQVTADARCCGRRMCVALCPTAALTVAETGDGAELAFDSARCIACGTCLRACPEGAMHLAPQDGAPGRRVIATHPWLRCVACGERFTPTPDQRAEDGDAICPTCAKARRFMDDARRQLFGPAS